MSITFSQEERVGGQPAAGVAWLPWVPPGAPGPRGRSAPSRWTATCPSTCVRGEAFGSLGNNGSGKTTTLRALPGIYRPTAGVLHVGGADFSPAH